MPGSYSLFEHADYIDYSAFLFMGADPSWTPSRENRRALDDAPGGCALCGGEGGKIGDGDRVVCARCQRYGRDESLGGTSVPADPAKAAEPVAGDEPGYVLKRTPRGTITVPEKYARLMKG